MSLSNQYSCKTILIETKKMDETMVRMKHLKNPEKIPPTMEQIFESIVKSINAFCKEHLKGDLCAAFGLAQSTVSNKSKQIRDMLKITQFDVNWTLPSKVENNPLAWMISINGFIADARYLPLEIQAEAFRKGLIPYVPGSKNKGN